MTPSESSHTGVSPAPRDGSSPGDWQSAVGKSMTGVDHFNVMSLELLSGILLWGGAGWLLDRWLGTAHWFFGFGVMLGFAAGLYLVWLRTNGPTPAPPTTTGREAPRGGG